MSEIKRMTTMISISDLPFDLESEILSRVPSKSLAKLRTTCKRWYALFKDPKFVRMNNLAKGANEEVMLLMNFRVYSISLNLLHGIQNNADPSMNSTGTLKCLEDSKDLKVSQIFHCDGLILCFMKEYTRLVVWNPCTGDTRSIKPRICYRRDDTYGLGYGNSESSCRIYKILRYGCNYNDQKRLLVNELEIYDFSSDKWRVLDEFTDKWIIRPYTVSLKGKTYWIASEKEARYARVLLSFDFKSERFVSFPLPYQSDHSCDRVALSAVREERLAVLRQNTSSEMKVWLSNKIDNTKEVSWSKFLVVHIDKLRLPHFPSAFLVDEQNKVVVCCRKDISGDTSSVYIVGENLHKQVYKETAKGSPFNWPLLLSYVPSLVHIPKLKEEEKRGGY